MEALRGHLQNFSTQVQTYLPDLSEEHHRQINQQIGKQLSAEEVLQHPEYPHVNWKLSYEKRERIDVAAGRGGPFKIAYELHGHGPRKIVVRLAPDLAQAGPDSFADPIP